MSIHEEITEIAERIARKMICERFGHEYQGEYSKDYNSNLYRNCTHCDTTQYKWQE